MLGPEQFDSYQKNKQRREKAKDVNRSRNAKSVYNVCQLMHVILISNSL